MNNLKPSAWICVNHDGQKNRGRVKNHKGNIYLKNETEFELELYNPTTENVLAVIKMNGKPISSAGIVIRNGERVYLDCYPDDQKKFTFTTYEVEDNKTSNEAIAHNGKVEILFYKEKAISLNTSNWITLQNYPWSDGTAGSGTWQNPYTYTTSGNATFNLSSGVISNTAQCYYSSNDELNMTKCCSSERSIETGQVGKGTDSDQQFTTVNMDFESYIHNVVEFQIFPESRKPATKKSLSKKIKPTSMSQKLDNLEKLNNLKESGAITDDEFGVMKQEILNS